MPSAVQNDEDFPFAEVGARLRAARAKVGMTRKQLATASGTSERYLAHIETGIGNPSLSVLTALAFALGLTVPDLLPLGGERDARYARAVASVRRLPPERLDDFFNWVDQSTGRAGTKARRIALIGLRGAGKSTLGQSLALRLSVPFFEMSKEVEQAYGGPISLLIEVGGQSALGKYESDVWEAIREEQDCAIIAAPGGVVANSPLYDRILATAHTIWLEASPEDHMSRVMAQGDFRPMASSRDAMADLKAILESRSLEYGRADLRFDTSKQDFEETVDLLERAARSLMQYKS